MKINYDVNTKNKIIDIHKQWQGGLKTVDTDDALGATYLRDAQNVSISEYNFLEKRYGLLEKHSYLNTFTLQGYFEYVESNGDITTIHVMGGYIYVNEVLATPTQRAEDDFSPNFTVPTYPYQTDRVVEGVRISDVLHIYTGTHPVYYNGDGNIYLTPPRSATYEEIRDLGFNLINKNYEEDLYIYEPNGFVGEYQTLGDTLLFTVDDHTMTPRVPSKEIIGDKVGEYPGADPVWFTDITKSQISFSFNCTFPSDSQDSPWSGNDIELIASKVEIKSAGALDSEYTEITNKTDSSTAWWSSSSTHDLYVDEVLQQSLNYRLLTNALRVHFRNLDTGDYSIRFTIDYNVYDGNVGGGIVLYQNRQVYEVKDIPVTVEPLLPPADLPTGVETCNRVTEHYGKVLAYGNPTHPEQLYISSYKDPTYFPAYHYMEFENELQEGLTSVVPFMNILVVQTESKTYGVKGNTALEPLLFNINETSQFERFNINLSVGCIAPKTVKPVRNRLYFLSRQGITSLKSLYAVDEHYNIEYIDRNVENIIPKDPEAVAIQHDNQYWIDFPNHGFNLRYYIDKRAWVKDVYNITDYQGVFKYIPDNGTLRIITRRSNARIYDILVDKSLPYDFGNPPLTRIIPAFLDQNMPFHPKNYKELKMNLTLQNEYNDQQGAVATTVTADTTTYKAWEFEFMAGHKYKFEFTNPAPVSLSFSITNDDGTLYSTTLAPNQDVSAPIYAPYTEDSSYNLTVSDLGGGNMLTYAFEINLLDITYETQVDFDVWATTEKSVLASPETTTVEIINDEAVEVYNKTSNLTFDLGTNLSTWVFGISEFGKTLTAVKTLKLSGKGYNFRFKIEDQTASKWTLESVGITFKMKKARSR